MRGAAKVKRRTQRYLLQELSNIRKRNRCICCGRRGGKKLQFHHVDRNSKLGSLMEVTFITSSVELVHRELDKCELMCGDCHRWVHRFY